MSENKNKNRDVFSDASNTTNLRSVAEDAAKSAIQDAQKKAEDEFAADPDFDLDKTLSKQQDRYNNEFGFDTGALDLDSLTDEDRDILSETRPIHIERDDIPEETQAIHILTLEKAKRKKHKNVYKLIIGLMGLCIAISIIGIVLNNKIKEKRSQAGEPTPTVSTEAVNTDDDGIEITESAFPDEAFREWVSTQADTNGDGELSPEERNAVIILNITSGDVSRYTNFTGLSYFPLIQAINISGAPVTELDLSSNTKLKNIDISSTQIANLDLSNNSDVTEINVANSAIQSITLPENSLVTSINTEGTSLECTKTEDTFTGGCSVAAQVEEPAAEVTSEAEVPVEETPAVEG